MLPGAAHISDLSVRFVQEFLPPEEFFGSLAWGKFVEHGFRKTLPLERILWRRFASSKPFASGSIKKISRNRALSRSSGAGCG
jgi:hypothetical protein